MNKPIGRRGFWRTLLAICTGAGLAGEMRGVGEARGRDSTEDECPKCGHKSETDLGLLMVYSEHPNNYADEKIWVNWHVMKCVVCGNMFTRFAPTLKRRNEVT